MNKAERMFRLALLLKRGRVVRAVDLARELRVSERTIYRDVQSLVLAGVPIEGEAGIGYVLRRGMELPPLMFTPDEAKALALGARMVRAWGDPALEEGAKRVLEKVQAVASEELQNDLSDPTLMVPGFHVNPEVRQTLGLVRRAITDQNKITFSYVRADGEPSQRVVWPLGVTYWGQVWSMDAWCEMRVDFRNFRIDRMSAVKLMKKKFKPTKDISLEALLHKFEGM
jgi:predicted DNA-binding transcriptional regulator YafY